MDDQAPGADIGSVFGFSLTAALVAGIFFAAAANSETSSAARDLALFAAALLVLALGARLWGRLGMARLRVDLSVDRDRLFPGETLEFRALIENRKALPVWTRIELERPEALRPADGEQVDGEAGLMPYETIEGSWTFGALRRGVYALGPARLAAGDLLGLFRRERTQPFPREIVVFPRLAPIGDLELPFRDYFGIHPSKGIIEDPAWYEGTREYSGNRPAKSIHWKASARLGSLQEKIFGPTSHRKAFFLFDSEGFRAAEDREGFESALETLAALASRFAETGASFAAAVDCRVLGYSPVLPLGRGPEHLGKVLELFARCAAEAGAALAPLVSGANASGAGFVVVSRSPDERTARLFGMHPSKRDRTIFLFAEEARANARGLELATEEAER